MKRFLGILVASMFLASATYVSAASKDEKTKTEKVEKGVKGKSDVKKTKGKVKSEETKGGVMGEEKAGDKKAGAMGEAKKKSK
jgi:hypothetical protein